MGLTERIARVCAAHPVRTTVVWIAVFAAALASVALLMTGLTTEGTVAGEPESVRAERILERAFPPDPRTTVTDVVVVRSDVLTVEDEEFRVFVDRLEREIRNTGDVAASHTYFGTNRAELVSRDRHATLITLYVPDDGGADDVVPLVEQAEEDPSFSATVTGDTAIAHDFNHLSERDLQEGELKFGLPAALLILVLVFGAIVAALVPLLMAIVSIVVALGIVAILSQLTELSVFIVNMLTGMGLALGIDYSLFVISRYREERAAGRGTDAAIWAAGATASRAVLFSGTAFVIALCGMLIVPTSIMRSLAAGAIIVGIVSVAAALTLLPALLGFLHDRVDALRLPLIGRRSIERSNPEGRFWSAVIDRVLRRPAVSLAVAAGLLLAAAVPVLGMNIGASGVTSLPDDLPSKRGFLALQRDFPDFGTDQVHVVVPEASGEINATLDHLRNRIAAEPTFGPGEIRIADGALALNAPMVEDALSEESVAAVRELRDETVPGAFAGTGAEAYVGGVTSANIDYFDAVTDPAPIVFAFVLGLSFVLLTVAFRSIVVAGTAIVLNLLSVGAAYGLLVLVFQRGVGAELLGFRQVDTIEAWVPLFLFSVLFALSMDYQVFLLSRIRERYDQTRATIGSVRWGVASTARIITGAALIIVAVFAGFARGDLVMFQQMGFGVAVALLLDATVIRAVILPAIMALLGERNWWLPRRLEWIPHLEVEGHAEPERR